MVKFCDLSENNGKENDISTTRNKKRKRKHIPHSQRPGELVIKRNSRERERARSVNRAFEVLRRRTLSLDCGDDKLTKVEILKNATTYIQNLFQLILDYELQQMEKFTEASDTSNVNQLSHQMNLKQMPVDTNEVAKSNSRKPLMDLTNLPTRLDRTDSSAPSQSQNHQWIDYHQWVDDQQNCHHQNLNFHSAQYEMDFQNIMGISSEINYNEELFNLYYDGNQQPDITNYVCANEHVENYEQKYLHM